MDNSIEYFGSARTALKVALEKINVEEGSYFLLPDTICDVLTHPLIQLNMNIIFYPLNDQLSPDWKVLDVLARSKNCFALVMVHYFGQPQNIESFLSFCSLHELILIEDNAHGSGGSYNDKLLGTFGHIGISSPRKFLNIPCGGELHGNIQSSDTVIIELAEFPIFRFKIVAKMLIFQLKHIKNFIIHFRNKKNDWNDPYLYKESVQPDYYIDAYSRLKIISTNWLRIGKKRRSNWIAWQDFVRSKDLQPVFQEIHEESCPWAFPVYAADINERNLWLEWGAKNNLALFTWPSLPENIVNINGDALRRWKTMICFPLEFNPKELGCFHN